MSISTAPGRAFSLAGATVNGRYRVTAIASVGEDVVVYAAQEIRYGRPIALKVLRDEVKGDTDFVTAVFDRASTLALSPHAHRGLPRIYDCARTESGDLFIALEPIKGVTLREVLDARGPLNVSTALRIASQVGEALETLHHSRIVHGELSPDAVLLVKDETGTERVTLVDVELTGAYRTACGQRRRGVAEPAFRAPEQVEGGAITEATDQYGLGLLLRAMLTADQSGDTGADGSRPPLPPDVERIIATALEAESTRRFPDISVMVNDLWAAQTALPDSAPRPRRVESRASTRRRGRHRRPHVPLRIAAAVATGGLIAAVVWFAVSGALASRVRALVPEPGVSAAPATPVPFERTERVTVPAVSAAPAAVAKEAAIPRETRPLKTISTSEGFAHPSAAPRPAAVEPAARPEAAGTNGGDGAAIIDWVLSRRR